MTTICMLIVIFFIGIVGIIKKTTENKKAYTFVVIISLLLIILQVINFTSENKNRTFAPNLLDIIVKTDWSNKIKMQEYGFEYRNDYAIKHIDSDKYLCTIVIEPYEYDIESKKGLKRYKDIYYRVNEISLGIFDINRILGKNIFVSRRYTFVLNNIQITVTEDVCNDSYHVFEDFINNSLKL